MAFDAGGARSGIVGIVRRLLSTAILLAFTSPLWVVTTACGGSDSAKQAKKPASCPYRRPSKKKSYWWRKAQDR